MSKPAPAPPSTSTSTPLNRRRVGGRLTRSQTLALSSSDGAAVDTPNDTQDIAVPSFDDASQDDHHHLHPHHEAASSATTMSSDVCTSPALPSATTHHRKSQSVVENLNLATSTLDYGHPRRSREASAPSSDDPPSPTSAHLSRSLASSILNASTRSKRKASGEHVNPRGDANSHSDTLTKEEGRTILNRSTRRRTNHGHSASVQLGTPTRNPHHTQFGFDFPGSPNGVRSPLSATAALSQSMPPSALHSTSDLASDSIPMFSPSRHLTSSTLTTPYFSNTNTTSTISSVVFSSPPTPIHGCGDNTPSSQEFKLFEPIGSQCSAEDRESIFHPTANGFTDPSLDASMFDALQAGKGDLVGLGIDLYGRDKGDIFIGVGGATGGRRWGEDCHDAHSRPAPTTYELSFVNPLSMAIPTFQGQELSASSPPSFHPSSSPSCRDNDHTTPHRRTRTTSRSSDIKVPSTIEGDEGTANAAAAAGTTAPQDEEGEEDERFALFASQVRRKAEALTLDTGEEDAEDKTEIGMNVDALLETPTKGFLLNKQFAHSPLVTSVDLDVTLSEFSLPPMPEPLPEMTLASSNPSRGASVLDGTEAESEPKPAASGLSRSMPASTRLHKAVAELPAFSTPHKPKPPRKEKTPRAHHNKVIEGRIPRPPNSFILYRSDRLRQLKEERKKLEARQREAESLGKSVDDLTRQQQDERENELGISVEVLNDLMSRPQAQMSQWVAKLWHDEPIDVKEYYEKQADLVKAKHKQQHPDYRFLPIKKALKEEAQRAGDGQLKEENGNGKVSSGEATPALENPVDVKTSQTPERKEGVTPTTPKKDEVAVIVGKKGTSSVPSAKARASSTPKPSCIPTRSPAPTLQRSQTYSTPMVTRSLTSASEGPRKVAQSTLPRPAQSVNKNHTRSRTFAAQQQQPNSLLHSTNISMTLESHPTPQGGLTFPPSPSPSKRLATSVPPSAVSRPSSTSPLPGSSTPFKTFTKTSPAARSNTTASRFGQHLNTPSLPGYLQPTAASMARSVTHPPPSTVSSSSSSPSRNHIYAQSVPAYFQPNHQQGFVHDTTTATTIYHPVPRPVHTNGEFETVEDMLNGLAQAPSHEMLASQGYLHHQTDYDLAGQNLSLPEGNLLYGAEGLELQSREAYNAFTREHQMTWVSVPEHQPQTSQHQPALRRAAHQSGIPTFNPGRRGPGSGPSLIPFTQSQRMRQIALDGLLPAVHPRANAPPMSRSHSSPVPQPPPSNLPLQDGFILNGVFYPLSETVPQPPQKLELSTSSTYPPARGQVMTMPSAAPITVRDAAGREYILVEKPAYDPASNNFAVPNEEPYQMQYLTYEQAPVVGELYGEESVTSVPSYYVSSLDPLPPVNLSDLGPLPTPQTGDTQMTNVQARNGRAAHASDPASTSSPQHLLQPSSALLDEDHNGGLLTGLSEWSNALATAGSTHPTFYIEENQGQYYPHSSEATLNDFQNDPSLGDERLGHSTHQSDVHSFPAFHLTNTNETAHRTSKSSNGSNGIGVGTVLSGQDVMISGGLESGNTSFDNLQDDINRFLSERE